MAMNIADFHFIRPYWLLALLPAITIVALLLRTKLNQGIWSAICDEALLPYLLQGKDSTTKRWPLVTGALAVVLSIIALAGPTWQRLPAPAFRNTSALVIALDLSRSMDAEDIKPSRLIRARYKIADLLKQRKDGQTALLVYAGDAFVVTPLTDDVATIDSQLSALTTDIMPSPGSNVSAALAKAVDLFKQAGLPKGRIVLVTDGVDVDKAIGYASANAGEYSVSVLGIGTEDGAPIALPEGGFLKDEQGAIVVPKLNAEELSGLAQAGGGIYQTITANDADIQNLTAFIDESIQQHTISDTKDKENANLMLELWDDKGPWLLLLVLPLAALSFRKGLLVIAFLVLLPLPNNSYAFDWQDLWLSKDQQAQQAYRRKDFAKAAEQFNNPEWKAAAYYQAGDYEKALKNYTADQAQQTSDNLYNQGNALAKSGQLEPAIKAYEHALSINPDNADAKYNKDLVAKALEKQQQQKQDQQQGKENSGQDNKQSQDKEGEQSAPSDNGQKPEQKPEKSGKEENAAEQQADKKQASEDQQQQKAEAEQAQKAGQGKDEKEQKSLKQGQAETADAQLTDEQQQANEQWLKRIPDDPSGLLRRKFKYQYGQRGR